MRVRLACPVCGSETIIERGMVEYHVENAGWEEHNGRLYSSGGDYLVDRHNYVPSEWECSDCCTPFSSLRALVRLSDEVSA
jgi:hypothetical protein